MRIAGLGFRADAPMQALRAALDAACAGGAQPDALATLAKKAQAPQLRALSEASALPVIAVAPDALARQSTLTQSPRQKMLFGTGSLAEAAALAAAGPGAQLAGPRRSDPSGQATAAIAFAKETP